VGGISWRHAGLAALLAIGAAGPAGAQARLQSADEALAQDAATWARAAGLDPVDALARLRAQEAGAAVTDALAREFAGRLAGLWVEQRPAHRIVVRLTGGEPVPSRIVTIAGLSVPIDFAPGATLTREALLVALADRQAAIRAALVQPPGIGIDPRTDGLVVLAGAGEVDREGRAAMAARLAAVAGVPVAVRALGREDDMTAGGGAAGGGAAGEDVDGGGVEGGARVVGVSAVDGRRYACTAGFAVTDGVRSAVVTAAHCPDALSVVDPAGGGDVPLDFAGQWGWGYQDVQVNVSPGVLGPRFLADTGKTVARAVTGARPRGATRVGDVVCHRGERTGYSCAEVAFTDFAPAGDLCGGACLPTWVAVRGPSCKGGDSGGPVFLGGVAYGIVKGGSYRAGDGRCGFYYYMSTDYLPTGWSLLRAAPAISPLPTGIAAR